MEEFEKLVLEVESKGMDQANTSLDQLEKKAGAAESAVEDLKDSGATCSAAIEKMAKSVEGLMQELRDNSTAAKANSAALEVNTAANAAAATTIQTAVAALTAHATAAAADTTATAAATAADTAHTAATVADASATAADTAATAANILASEGNTVAKLAVVGALVAEAIAMARSSIVTGLNTARTATAAAMNYAYAKSAAVATGAVGLLRAGVMSLYVKLAAIAAPLILITQLVGATKSYQDFNAQLMVATKSAQGAKEAYAALTDFASGTPYALDTATGAFIKLVNLGLTPSERALTSYGNTASAMGKDLNDMIEAVADAATFEFERLKEFGIKASKQGDQIKFMFQGVSTTVKASAAEVEKYLMGLGENQFAGAMEARMKTLGGVMSNLGDEWSKLMVNISEAGAGELITEAFTAALHAVEELNAQLKSGQLQAHIEAYAGMWADTFNEVKQDFENATRDIETGTSKWGDYVDTAVDVMKEAFEFFPINVKATMEVVGAYLYRLVASGKIAASTAVDVMINEFERLREHIRIINLEMKSWFNETVVDMGSAIEGANKKFDAQHDAILKAAESERKTLSSITNIDDIIENRDAKIQALKDEHAEADELRKAYELIKHVREAQDGKEGDRLAKFKVGGGSAGDDAGGGGGGKGKKGRGTDIVRQSLEEEFKLLEEGLLKEHETMSMAYEKRKEMILENTALTEQERRDMVMMSMNEAILTEEEALREQYDRRKEIILKSTEMTETAKNELISRLDKKRTKDQLKIEGNFLQEKSQQLEEGLGNLQAVAEVFGKKGFAVAKGLAIAKTIVSTAAAAMKAYEEGGPYAGPALAATIVAAGAAQVATISATQYSGAYEFGGMIPAGKFGMVGEAGPEFVRGPAVVTSATTTAASQNSEGLRVVVNNYGAPAAVETSLDRDQLMITLRPMLERNKQETKMELASEIDRGGGKVSQAMEKRYRLNRGA